MLEKGVKPVYVFDGIPGELKQETLAKRREVRTDAEAKASEALQTGNMDRCKKIWFSCSKINKRYG